MPAQDVLANLLSTIHNNEMRNKKECLVVPASRLASEVLRVMQRYKFIGEFEYIDDAIAGKLRVQLLGRISRCGVVSPRFSVKRGEYGTWERLFLPALGVGVLIVSTPQGVMAHVEAEEKGAGGRLLAFVY